MKKVTYLIAVLAMTLVISNYKTLVRETQQQAVRAAQTERKLSEQRVELKARVAAQNERQAQEQKAAEAAKVEAAKPATTCRAAIQKTWPAELQAGAMIVLQNENGTEAVDRRGAVNSDGSQDFGCMQINNRWHAAFFASNNWADPMANTAYAYQIYKSRGNWTAWYAVKGILW